MKVVTVLDIYARYISNLVQDLLKGSSGEPHSHAGTPATDYSEWYYNRPWARAHLSSKPRARNLVDMIERAHPTRIFEFGSGLGYVLREARRRGIDMTGSETSGYAFDHSLIPDAMVQIDEIPPGRLPFDDGSFDLVFSTEVMEHVSESSTLPVLQELRRICSARAIFTINTFDTEEFGHINIHPRAWWEEKFAASGFTPDRELWTNLDRMKTLDWEIFAMRTVPGWSSGACDPPDRPGPMPM